MSKVTAEFQIALATHQRDEAVARLPDARKEVERRMALLRQEMEAANEATAPKVGPEEIRTPELRAVLGLELAEAFVIERTATGRDASVLHSFYRLGDGGFLVFFEATSSPFEFKTQHDFDLHMAMEVPPEALEAILAKGRAAGIDTRGPSDHGVMRSICLNDPNGHVVELAARTESRDAAMDPARNGARTKRTA